MSATTKATIVVVLTSCVVTTVFWKVVGLEVSDLVCVMSIAAGWSVSSYIMRTQAAKSTVTSEIGLRPVRSFMVPLRFSVFVGWAMTSASMILSWRSSTARVTVGIVGLMTIGLGHLAWRHLVSRTDGG